MRTSQPPERALHLRWLSTEFRDKIHEAARQRQITMVDFVISIVRPYLNGGAPGQPVGIYPICQRREAVQRGKMTAKAQPQAKPDEQAAPQPTTCRHGLPFHPACLNRDSSHAHGPWWPREKCPDEQCRMRTPGLEPAQRQGQAARA